MCQGVGGAWLAERESERRRLYARARASASASAFAAGAGRPPLLERPPLSRRMTTAIYMSSCLSRPRRVRGGATPSCHGRWWGPGRQRLSADVGRFTAAFSSPTHHRDRAPRPREHRLDQPRAVQQAQQKGNHQVDGDADAAEADHDGDLVADCSLFLLPMRPLNELNERERKGRARDDDTVCVRTCASLDGEEEEECGPVQQILRRDAAKRASASSVVSRIFLFLVKPV